MGKVKIYPPTVTEQVDGECLLPGILATPSGLALLEIQGTLNSTVPYDGADDTQPALDIGKLSFPLYDAADTSGDTSWHKKVFLYVGSNQRLTGELKRLPNPLAVMRKRASDASQVDEELEMVDIIYFKLMFAHRPEPFGATVQS